jgi:peptidyl-prolyl cis-trans isomerase B (cyclophilin B)
MSRIARAAIHPAEVRMLHRAISLVALGCLLALVPLAGCATAQDTRAAAGGRRQAVITLQKGGEIRIEFFPEDAPRTVENFVKLASEKFYDNQFFHRVEPGFVVQAGDPQSRELAPGDMRLGTGGPGYRIKAEFNKQKHERGVIAMARSRDPDSAGSQFYITLAPAHSLDGQYTVFGRVVSGMEVVDAIKVGDRITSIRIVSR